MASVVLSGDTSGSVSLTVPAVAGTNTVTIPAETGTVLTTAVSGVCRAWVNFNGTGTIAIRASFNVSSITDGGVGDYTINFTTALSDANYCAVAMSDRSNNGGASLAVETTTSPTTTALKVRNWSDGGVQVDALYANVAVFR